ncbi:Serine/threonine protein kinase [Nonomuraea solani]|uniref:Serine/threonine protein kinase n=1 Tax=Nonomuraea solani TaxID=1144553 RepID=A0A1H6EQW0_9ACTN|nr:serine/threonine-protein kinase [Nonomuraea solani]SEH00238.1 Serine/threonine protein kinase [Nonomuraea solani]
MKTALTDADPRQLGDYWLASRLGVGGQGVVYEAYDSSGTRVAIKAWHPDPANRPEVRDRLTKEVVSAQRVASFCTARVLGADLEAERPYIVSEYVEGPSLRAADRVFGGDDLHRLATAIATALTAIHDAGVVHRDLKPDNVLLGPDGPRVIDFGVARTLDMSLTSTGIVAGTPSYMAPEVYSGQRAGTAADVFAWGAVVLFAATGKDPFTAEALGAVMHRVLSHDPDLAVLPAPLRTLVGAALAKDPDRRPPARDLLLALISGDLGLQTAHLLERGAGEGARLTEAVRDPVLEVLAEDAFAALSPAERELVPEVFLRLVTVTEAGQLTLRQARRAEFPEGADRVLKAFAYVVSDGDPVRLTRPALLPAWPWLRAWVAANRDGLAVHRRIWTAAERWQEQGRREADLFQGSSLDDALRWAAAERRNITLTPDERDFLAAGAALTRRRSRRSRLVSITLAVLLSLALVAGLMLVRQSAMLAGQRDVAESARLAGVAGEVRGKDPVLGMLLSAAAGRLAPTDEARSALLASAAHHATRSFRDPDTGPATARTLSADGRSLISVGPDEVKVWDVGTGRRTGGFTGLGLTGKRLRQAAISPDGRLLAVADHTGVGLWEMATGRRTGYRVPADENFDLTISFSGRHLVADFGQGKMIYDPESGKTTSLAALTDVAVHPKGGYAVGAEVWALPSGETLPGFEGACGGCASIPAFSPDGALPALAMEDELVVYDTRTRKKVHTLQEWDTGTTPVFGRDSRTLIGYGDQITVYRLTDDPVLLRHPAEEPATAAALGPEGLRYLADDTVVTLETGYVRSETMDDIGFSPDGRVLATHAEDSAAVMVNGRPVELAEPSAFEIKTAFSRDGGRLAIEAGEQVTVWDLAAGKELARVPLPEITGLVPDSPKVLPVPQGVWLAGDDFVLREVPGGRLLKQVPRPPRLLDWAVAADGRLVGLDGDTLRLIDVVAGKPLGPPLSLPGVAREIWFSGDLKLVAAGFSGKVGIWDTATGRQVGTWARAGYESSTAAFSHDGRLFALALDDRSMVVWDVRQGRQVGPVVELPDSAYSIAFTPGSREVLTVGRAGRASRLPVAVEPLLKAVCARAGRALTEAEWVRYLPDRPYEKSC